MSSVTRGKREVFGARIKTATVRCCVLLATFSCVVLPAAGEEDGAKSDSKGASKSEAVSYHRDVRPIFQARCQGCHQPAKAQGDYVMTRFDRLLAGGESGDKAVVPGKPDASHLLAMVTPDKDGEAEMPEDADPLSPQQVDLIRRWIAQGAVDDTPSNAQQRYDMDHPPVYSMAPVITSIAYSPDGRWLAVAGFHEVLLHRAGGGLVARLVGLSERVESVSFSPDGKRLAVTGGLPARSGELQVWRISPSESADKGAKKDDGANDKTAKTPAVDVELELSIPVSHDTIYGGTWSPDGKYIAVGCADNTLRAFDASSGKQVLFQGAHNDWVLDAVFSHDGKHLISVGRDMTAKLTEFATERFVDNITSITPGVLQGGIQAVARHPERDEIVIGGSDGVPKVYRVFRQTARRIGDDANLIRRLPRMKGRVFAVAVSRDGKRIASGSGIEGVGQVAIDSYEFDTSLTDELKRIMSKVATTRSAEERKKLEAYRTRNVKRLASVDLPATIYAVAFSPDGKTLAAAGSDGVVRLIDATNGKIRATWEAAPIAKGQAKNEIASVKPIEQRNPEDALAETPPPALAIKGLHVEPSSITLRHAHDAAQVLVTAELPSGDTIDVTRMVTWKLDSDIVQVTRRGAVYAHRDGQAQLSVELAGKSATVAVGVTGCSRDTKPDFIQDVAPVISKLGCNQGTCHGAAKGKNGFRLSLRGYDPVMDVRGFTDDLASRRTNIASPDDSLMLLKATTAAPHMGGRLMVPGDDAYMVIRNWIASGAKLDRKSPKVTGIELVPRNPTIQQIGARQQFRVLATYADGTVRDVTRLTHISSGNSEVAKADEYGLLTSVRRGEAPILARYEGAYDATTLTVMGDRDGFEWKEPPGQNRIDELVAAKWRRLKILPSDRCDDATFLRRITLDLTGLPPEPGDVRRFVADARPSEVKRTELIDRLLASDAFVDYWTNKWADLLMVNRKYLGTEGAKSFRDWIRGEIKQGTPYDEFVRRIVTASGSNRENPAASYFKILRTPESVMETTTQLFLAVRFNCNKCHDHPFERWTQDQYYQTAAFFAQFELKADPESKGRKIGGSAVEGAKPFYEIVSDKPEGEIKHIRTGEVAKPKFPVDCEFDVKPGATRRERFAAWLTSPDNPYFAKSYVNRLWGYLLGVGLIEPLDDIRAGNPASNPELLDHLTREFVKSGFDMRHVIRIICQSRTYQLELATNRWNEDDRANYSHALARRLPAEVIFDSIHRVTGSVPKFPGVPAGTRAAQLPDVGVKLPSGFLDTLGRPPRQSACECERVNGIQLGVVMALINGPVVTKAIHDPKNALAQLVKKQPDDRKLVEEVYLRVLGRVPDPQQVDQIIAAFKQIDKDHEAVSAQLAEREAWWKKEKPKLEQRRARSLAKAKADLAAYRKKIEPQRKAAESKRKAEIAAAEKKVKEREAALSKSAWEWLAGKRSSVEWFPVRPEKAQASKGLSLYSLPDRSIRATGDAEKGLYTITFRTRLKNVSGIRLEALPVEGIPGGGPGLSTNGNFVVTEFEAFSRPIGKKGAKFERVTLTDPIADYSQESFSPAQAIDGALRGGKGWAVVPATGIVHWAVFHVAKPVGDEQGTEWQIKIHQFHPAKKHVLGRFRISFTTDRGKLALGLPESLAAIASTGKSVQAKENLAKIVAYRKKTDAKLTKADAALAAARRPVPVDPGVKEREALVKALEKPTPDDRRLVELRHDVKVSKQQVDRRRLTAVQDLAWALINSPAFLFNY